MIKCSVDGCENTKKTKGYCSMHYARWRRHGDPNKVLNIRSVIKGSNKICNVCNENKPLTEFHKGSGAGGCNSYCKSCQKQYRQQYVSENRDKVNEYKRKWQNERYKKKKTEIRQYKKDWRKKNLDKEKARVNEWKKKNREKVRESEKTYRQMNKYKVKIYNYVSHARMNDADGDCNAKQLEARIAFYGWRCWICKDDFQQVDHVKPINKGGSNFPANLRPICTSCNSSKQDKWQGSKNIHSVIKGIRKIAARAIE
jgi:5-methylcytosine-specific restriction endonuclease McrA